MPISERCSLYGTLAAGAAPIGLAAAGPVAELIGTRGLYIAGGAAYVVVAVIALSLPAIWALEDMPVHVEG